jgi:hypothetical protein
VVTGYHLAEDGTFEEAERHVSTMAAAGGVWTTAPDLVRFGHNWTTLLIGLSTGGVTVAATNRRVPMDPVNARLRRPIG